MAAAAQLRTQVLLHHLELDKNKLMYGDTLSQTQVYLYLYLYLYLY